MKLEYPLAQCCQCCQCWHSVGRVLSGNGRDQKGIPTIFENEKKNVEPPKYILDLFFFIECKVNVSIFFSLPILWCVCSSPIHKLAYRQVKFPTFFETDSPQKISFFPSTHRFFS